MSELSCGVMPHIFPKIGRGALRVGRIPWSAADPPVGLPGATMRLFLPDRERVQGDPRGPGGPPYFGKVCGITHECVRHEGAMPI
jgi:hypothetical protein